MTLPTSGIDWCLTTEAYCWGEPLEGEPERFALYDGREDDPPIAVFESREWAETVRSDLARLQEVRVTATDELLACWNPDTVMVVDGHPTEKRCGLCAPCRLDDVLTKP